MNLCLSTMHKYKITIQGESGIFTGFFKCSEEFISSELIIKIKKDSTGLLLDKVYYKQEKIINIENTNVELHYLLHHFIHVHLMESREKKKGVSITKPVSLNFEKEVMKTRLDVFLGK